MMHSVRDRQTDRQTDDSIMSAILRAAVRSANIEASMLLALVFAKLCSHDERRHFLADIIILRTIHAVPPLPNGRFITGLLLALTAENNENTQSSGPRHAITRQ